MLTRILLRRRLPLIQSIRPRPLPPQPSTHFLRSASHTSPPHTRTPIDSRIEELQDLYATARDEFEIASEETSKKTVYAADDRAAAQEELAKLKAAFEEAVREEGGEEVRNRVGGRIRELEVAVERMEEAARED